MRRAKKWLGQSSGTAAIESNLVEMESMIIKEMNELRLKDKVLFEETQRDR